MLANPCTCVDNVSGWEHMFGHSVSLIDTSQTVGKEMCLLFVEIDYFDVPETENMRCAISPDAQDDQICSVYKKHCENTFKQMFDCLMLDYTTIHCQNVIICRRVHLNCYIYHKMLRENNNSFHVKSRLVYFKRKVDT